jgi:hypothetical protein
VLSLGIVIFDCELKCQFSAEAQASFVILPNSNSTDAKLVTSLHNLMTDRNDAGFLQAVEGHSVETALGNSCAVTIPNTGWLKANAVPHPLRGVETWTTGVDVVLGPSISKSVALTTLSTNGEVVPFSMVDYDFVYKVGMKIGIGVYSTIGAEKEDALLKKDKKDISDVRLHEVFGEPCNVNIYAGEIKFVGEGHHFEHDINTFPISSQRTTTKRLLGCMRVTNLH